MITYKATNTRNGKFYIGSTVDFEKRKRQHTRCRRNTPFHNSLRKNPDDFVWEFTEDESNEPELEQALLDMWYGKEQCYNLCPFAGRPQVNVESARAWGILNGPTLGKRTYENRVGIFDPEAPKSEWAVRGGKATAKLHGKPIVIVHPDGSETHYGSIKEAVRSGFIPYGSLKRCLKDNRILRSGFTAKFKDHVHKTDPCV